MKPSDLPDLPGSSSPFGRGSQAFGFPGTQTRHPHSLGIPPGQNSWDAVSSSCPLLRHPQAHKPACPCPQQAVGTVPESLEEVRREDREGTCGGEDKEVMAVAQIDSVTVGWTWPCRASGGISSDWRKRACAHSNWLLLSRCLKVERAPWGRLISPFHPSASG